MKKTAAHFPIGFIILFATALFSLPANATRAPQEPSELWTCKAKDAALNQWSETADYERLAMQRALHQCKLESQKPSTCQVEFEACDVTVHTSSHRAFWRCTALDETATPWRGGVYTSRDDAAISANDFCKKHSGMPHTCYINLLTCTNLNLKNTEDSTS